MADNSLNIFFLASWFPNKLDGFEGDFILRQAQAVALYNKVQVAYAIEGAVPRVQLETEVMHPNLTIHRIYLPIHYKNALYKPKYYLHILKLFSILHAQQAFDMVHANVLWRAGAAALLIQQKYKIPYVISEHSGKYAVDYYGKEAVQNQNKVKQYIHKRVLQNAKACLCVSKFQAACIANFEPKGNYVLMSNTVNTEVFNFSNKTKNACYTYLHASMLTKEKNIGWLMQSISILRKTHNQFKVQIIGPINDALREQVQQLGVAENIELISLQPYASIARYMQAADAFILCSTIETQGCVAIESQCCGTPVIATKVGGLQEYVPVANGVLVDPTQPESLANAMLSFILKEKQFNNADISATSIEKYSYANIGKKISEVYQTALHSI